MIRVNSCIVQFQKIFNVAKHVLFEIKSLSKLGREMLTCGNFYILPPFKEETKYL